MCTFNVKRNRLHAWDMRGGVKLLMGCSEQARTRLEVIGSSDAGEASFGGYRAASKRTNTATPLAAGRPIKARATAARSTRAGWLGRVREGGTALLLRRAPAGRMGEAVGGGCNPRGDRAANSQSLRKCALLCSSVRVGSHLACCSLESGKVSLWGEGVATDHPSNSEPPKQSCQEARLMGCRRRHHPRCRQREKHPV